MKERITSLLYDLGIAPNIKGFNYIRDGITLVVEKPDMIDSITKQLYPEIAKLNKTTASRTERAIRHAIETSFNKCEPDHLQSIFSRTVCPWKGKPTNSAFIAVLAEGIRMGTLPAAERS
jgi:two-component system response regulator (stage 0 sporulation protein A)